MKKRTIEEQILTAIALLALVAVFTGWLTTAIAADKRVMIELEPGTEYTVIHVKQTDDTGSRFYGYHDSGVYPTVVVFDLCSFCVLEYRLGSACTVWNSRGETDRVKDGRRQKECEWTDWMPVPLSIIRPAPPELRT